MRFHGHIIRSRTIFKLLDDDGLFLLRLDVTACKSRSFKLNFSSSGDGFQFKIINFPDEHTLENPVSRQKVSFKSPIVSNGCISGTVAVDIRYSFNGEVNFFRFCWLLFVDSLPILGLPRKFVFNALGWASLSSLLWLLLFTWDAIADRFHSQRAKRSPTNGFSHF